jgi:hypothetical protein
MYPPLSLRQSAFGLGDLLFQADVFRPRAAPRRLETMNLPSQSSNFAFDLLDLGPLVRYHLFGTPACCFKGDDPCPKISYPDEQSFSKRRVCFGHFNIGHILVLHQWAERTYRDTPRHAAYANDLGNHRS